MNPLQLLAAFFGIILILGTMFACATNPSVIFDDSWDVMTPLDETPEHVQEYHRKLSGYESFETLQLP